MANIEGLMKLKAWLDNEDARRKIEEAVRISEKREEIRRMARRASYKTANEPCTI